MTLMHESTQEEEIQSIMSRLANSNHRYSPHAGIGRILVSIVAIIRFPLRNCQFTAWDHKTMSHLSDWPIDPVAEDARKIEALAFGSQKDLVDTDEGEFGRTSLSLHTIIQINASIQGTPFSNVTDSHRGRHPPTRQLVRHGPIWGEAERG